MVLLTVSVGAFVGVSIALFLVGFVLGAILTSIHIKKQIKENPPISEQQIREFYRQAGKKLSESQVQKIMKSMQQQN